MKKLWKLAFREIGQGFGRYMAILLIVALGVGFFSGLKTARPTMQVIVDEYVDEYALFDYRLLTTLGIEEEDVLRARQIPGVLYAEGSVATDFLALPETSEGESDSLRVFHAQSLTENINKVRLMAGEYPKAGNEILVDSLRFSEDQIGTTLTISMENAESTRDMFRYDTYVITGTVTSPYYLNFERGSSSIGNGSVEGFVYIPMDGFEADLYTELFLKVEAPSGIYSAPYEDAIEGYRDSLEACAEEIAGRRYESIRSDADEEIADAKDKLADARQELDDALAEIEDGEEKIASAKEELDKAREELDASWQDYESAKKELDDAREQARSGWAIYNEKKAQFDENRRRVDAEYAKLEAGRPYMSEEEYATGLAQIQYMDKELSSAEASIQSLKTQLEGADQSIQGSQGQMETWEEELLKAEDEIASHEAELADKEADLEEGRSKIADAQAEFEENEDKVKEAEEELAKLEEPQSYALDRKTNVGYACFENDSMIVEQVARVFPIFFFLVAALVCMTTMNRMVEEQRTQVGVMKALGYGNGAVCLKYMLYSGSAAFIGGIFGYFLGSFLFPKVIWIAYGIMYSVGGYKFVLVPSHGILSVLTALVCCMGTTYLTLRGVLTGVPAGLLRPKSPLSGKKIFLEYIPFLWKRFSFMAKVSSRNIFRYKKRLFMMVLGISGCTALLITGMGMNDTILNVVPEQYGTIQKYDANITLKDAASEELFDAFCLEQPAIESAALVHVSSVDVTHKGKTKSISMIIPSKEDQLSVFVDLINNEKGEKLLPFPKEGEAVISHKFAERLDIHTGDEITLMDGDLHTFTVRIGGICKNYISDYLYLSKETYQRAVSAEPAYKSIWCTLDPGSDAHEIGAGIASREDVSAIALTADMKERVKGMIKSMNYVVLLVIASAAALAFIVLYNLTNINITERIREIATIKVLGFYPRETALYVFRENLVLTGIGAVVGLFLGKALLAFVMTCINVDGVAFISVMTWQNVVISLILTFVFALLVDVAMLRRIASIDMAESLKSIE